MTTPVWVLLGFAVWTLLTLIATVGVYRWSLILAGRTAIGEWRADVPQGSDWYRRAMRAHANCVENLPVYGALVLVLVATGIRDAWLDSLALTMLGARVLHTLVHVALPQTNPVAAVRFALFFVQVVCMLAMTAVIVMRA
jgi:uncharacterized MAPEG superfamily protein